MFGYDDVQFSIAYPLIFFIIALVLLGAYSFWVYKYTVPPIGKIKKIILILLRSLALLTILLTLFEPILTLTKIQVLKPVNLVYFDNTNSIRINDGTNRTEVVNDILNLFKSNSSDESFEYYVFGNEPAIISIDSVDTLYYNKAVTNLSSIFSELETNERNIASVSLITDGVFTTGSNPLYFAEKLMLPVYTIGIGDTSRRDDVEIKKVLSNDILYAETSTTILTTITNKGFADKSINLELYENGKLLEQKKVTLNSSGVQNESFIYTPESSGEKKLQIKTSNLPAEFSSANNSKVIYVNVLSNKIKIVLVSGAPSADLSFIKNSLLLDKNFEVRSVTQIEATKIIEDNYKQKIDSADVLFLIGFPGNSNSQELTNQILKKIQNEKTPFFFLFNQSTSLATIKLIQDELPFIIYDEVTGSREVQPEIISTEINNPLIKIGNDNVGEFWNNLPPIHQSKTGFKEKPGSKTLAIIKIDNNIFNEPLILTRNFSGSKSIAVLGYNIWKWKLQTAKKSNNVLDNFLINSVKWLHSEDSQKRVKISTSKRSYSLGEQVEFSAQVYDESYNPVPDAKVSINIENKDEKYILELDAIGNGIYSGEIKLINADDYKFSGSATQNGSSLGDDKGTFSIDELNVEHINPVMNYELLSQLALVSNGKYFSSDQADDLITELEDAANRSKKEKIINSEFSLWSNEWMLIIAVLLFAIEWFLRKQSGML